MEYIDTTMKIFGYIMETAGVIGIMVGLYCWLRKPSTENKEILARHDKDITELKTNAEKDYNDIKDIKKLQSVMGMALVRIMDHQIYGNHTSDMEKTKNELLELLTNSK